jgi:hypothetical protein
MFNAAMIRPSSLFNGSAIDRIDPLIDKCIAFFAHPKYDPAKFALFERQNSFNRPVGSMKRRGKPAHSWVH